MAKINFTPWRDSSELLNIRSQFYPSSPTAIDLRPNACRTVEAWKLRGHLPHAVEATALLTDAILHDDAARNSVFSIRATYSAAFCRFVTGLVDSKLGGQRRTMFQRALDLGLPASFVELRHEATHRELPSLVVLRSTVHRSLEWLWGYYWAKIDLYATPKKIKIQPHANGHHLSGVRMQIKGCLQQLSQYDWTAAPSVKKKARAHAVSAASQALIRICEQEDDGIRVLSRVLLEDDILLPRERQLGSSMDRIFSTWDILLRTVSESHPPFLTILTEEMAKYLGKANRTKTEEQETANDPLAEAVYMWLEHIARSSTWEGQRAQISVSYLRAICNEMLNHWTAMLLERVLSDITPFFGVGHEREPHANDHALNLDIHADEGWESLGEYGWSCPKQWTIRPIGVS